MIVKTVIPFLGRSAVFFLHLRSLSPSDSSQKPWSDNPNAPQIPYGLYFWEKATVAGNIIGAIFYGLQTHMSVYSILAHLVYSINCSRYRHRTLLSIYGSPVRSRQSQEGRCEMGTRDLHCPHVLVCDRIHRNELSHPIHFFHRQP